MAEFYTVATLARFVGVSPRTIERWSAAGRLPKPQLRQRDGAKLWTPEQARTVLNERIRKSPREIRRRRRIP